jgi:hypothetical protein
MSVGRMAGISEATLKKVRALFPPELHAEVTTLLRDECGNNLPFLQSLDEDSLDRFRFAALKLSQGDLDKLRKAVVLAKKDWRDLLVAAGFANSLDAHRSWNP